MLPLADFILNSIDSVLILLLDRTGHVLFSSRVTQETLKSMPSTSIFQYVYQDDSMQLQTDLDAVASSSFQRQLRLVHANGEVFSYSVSGRAVENNGQQLILLTATNAYVSPAMDAKQLAMPSAHRHFFSEGDLFEAGGPQRRMSYPGIKQKRPPTAGRRSASPLGQLGCCTKCGATSSPEWRRGPDGPKTLCNACGLRWNKQNRKNDASRSASPAPHAPHHAVSQYTNSPQMAQLMSYPQQMTNTNMGVQLNPLMLPTHQDIFNQVPKMLDSPMLELPPVRSNLSDFASLPPARSVEHYLGDAEQVAFNDILPF